MVSLILCVLTSLAPSSKRVKYRRPAKNAFRSRWATEASHISSCHQSRGDNVLWKIDPPEARNRDKTISWCRYQTRTLSSNPNAIDDVALLVVHQLSKLRKPIRFFFEIAIDKEDEITGGVRQSRHHRLVVTDAMGKIDDRNPGDRIASARQQVCGSRRADRHLRAKFRSIASKSFGGRTRTSVELVGRRAIKHEVDTISPATIPQIVRGLGSDVEEQIQNRHGRLERSPQLRIIAVTVIVEPSEPDSILVEHAFIDIGTG